MKNTIKYTILIAVICLLGSCKPKVTIGDFKYKVKTNKDYLYEFHGLVSFTDEFTLNDTVVLYRRKDIKAPYAMKKNDKSYLRSIYTVNKVNDTTTVTFKEYLINGYDKDQKTDSTIRTVIQLKDGTF